MAVTSNDALSIVMLIFYTPACLYSLWSFIRPVHSPRFVWLEILTLAGLRIVGSAIELVANHQDPRSPTLLIVAAVLASAGTRFLFGAIQGLLNVSQRSEKGSGKELKLSAKRTTAIVQTLVLVGMVLAVVGGIKMSQAASVDQFDKGKLLLKAGSILYLAGFLVLSTVCGYYILQPKEHNSVSLVAIWGAILCLPFLLVRLVYFIALAFASDDSTLFSLLSPNVIVEALMATVEEFVVVLVISTAGTYIKNQAPRSTTHFQYPSSHFMTGSSEQV